LHAAWTGAGDGVEDEEAWRWGCGWMMGSGWARRWSAERLLLERKGEEV
jgi:hypothetical protein